MLLPARLIFFQEWCQVFITILRRDCGIHRVARICQSKPCLECLLSFSSPLIHTWGARLLILLCPTHSHSRVKILVLANFRNLSWEVKTIVIRFIQHFGLSDGKCGAFRRFYLHLTLFNKHALARFFIILTQVPRIVYEAVGTYSEAWILWLLRKEKFVLKLRLPQFQRL